MTGPVPLFVDVVSAVLYVVFTEKVVVGGVVDCVVECIVVPGLVAKVDDRIAVETAEVKFETDAVDATVVVPSTATCGVVNVVFLVVDVVECVVVGAAVVIKTVTTLAEVVVFSVVIAAVVRFIILSVDGAGDPAAVVFTVVVSRVLAGGAIIDAPVVAFIMTVVADVDSVDKAGVRTCTDELLFSVTVGSSLIRVTNSVDSTGVVAVYSVPTLSSGVLSVSVFPVADSSSPLGCSLFPSAHNFA